MLSPPFCGVTEWLAPILERIPQSFSNHESIFPTSISKELQKVIVLLDSGETSLKNGLPSTITKQEISPFQIRRWKR